MSSIPMGLDSASSQDQGARHSPAWLPDARHLIREANWFLPYTAEGCELVACDVHAASIAWARAHYPPQVRFVVNDPEPPLPERAGLFDLG